MLCVWNRYGHTDAIAKRFEQAGATVLVAENGYLGRDWRGQHWYALARGQHNGAGWTPSGEGRDLGIELKPWRTTGTEIVVLAQRGIGPASVREPDQWVERTVARLRKRTDRPIRVRVHPGENKAKPLDDDLQNAWACVTWASGAGLKSIIQGIPVFHGFPKWIGAPGASLLEDCSLEEPFRGDRQPMLMRLAWAMWRTEEIATGLPIKNLLT